MARRRKAGIEGIDSLLKKLKNAKADIPKVLEMTINQATKTIQGDAKQLAAFDTGYLSNNIYTRDAQKVRGGIQGEVYTAVEYAPYIEFGTGPIGRDNPVPMKYPGPLDYTPHGWTYYNEGKQRFFHTKGQIAKPFMYPALQMNKQIIKEDIAKAIEAYFKLQSKGDI